MECFTAVQQQSHSIGKMKAGDGVRLFPSRTGWPKLDTDSDTTNASSYVTTTCSNEESDIDNNKKGGVRFSSDVIAAASQKKDYDVSAGLASRDRRDMLLKSGRHLSRRASNLQKIPLTHQLEQEQIKKNEKKHNLRWYHTIFLFSTASLTVCLLQLYLPPPFGVMMTSAEVEDIGVATDGCEDGLDHCICPRETICATDALSIVLLTLARCSAYFDYPLYMMMFLSKCHNINNICRRTVLREWINFADLHKVHKLFGVVIGVETMCHSFFHMLRWGLNGDINLLLNTNTGITGVITVIITPLVVWPMIVPVLKQKIPFEIRKGLHYLVIVWAVALLWHAPSRIYYLIGVPALIYALDYLFGFFIRNTLIENAYFERYGENGVALHFENPQSWGEKPKTSYLYIMCPWISKYQWHAFTMFPEPNKPNHTMLCIGASGDWTKELHEKIKVPGYKSFYVLGPYLSEFSDRAVTTSNAIAVASGIGITPTLSLMMNYAGKKRINIIWMCRDAGLVEYVLHRFQIEAVTKNSYAFIYYTGKRELALPKNLPVNLFIFDCRPNLEESITDIITSIESGEDLPEDVHDSQLKIANVSFEKRMQVALGRVLEMYGADEMFEYAVEETQKIMFQLSEEAQEELQDCEANEVDVESAPLMRNVATPDDAVCLEGLDAMISKFCGGIGEYSQAELKEVFDQIDRDSTGFLDREDVDIFFDVLMVEKNCSGRSSRTLELSSHMDKVASKKMKSIGNRRMRLQTFRSLYEVNMLQRARATMDMRSLINDSNGKFNDWSIFYCGGTSAIEKNLKEISEKYGIAFAVEAFGW